jgi:two-component system chemotaxis sensor kinase CheA
MSGIEELVATFREEAAERLADLEAGLLALEHKPNDAEQVAAIFRALHTLKGSGAICGFDDLADLAHELETVFDKVRSGQLEASSELIGLTRRGGDLIKAMLADAEGWSRDEREELVAALRRLLSGARTYHIRFRPERDLLLDGTNPLLLLDELRVLGRCEVVAETGQIPPLDQLGPEDRHAGWEVRLTTSRAVNAIRDVFTFVEDRCVLEIEEVTDGAAPVTLPASEPAPSRADATGAPDQDDAAFEKFGGGEPSHK